MRFHFKTLKNKLFTSYSLIIGLSLVVILLIFQVAFSSNISNQAEITQRNLCASLVNSLNSEVEKLNTISMNIVYSNLIKSNFKEFLTLDVGSANAPVEVPIEVPLEIPTPIVPTDGTKPSTATTPTTATSDPLSDPSDRQVSDTLSVQKWHTLRMIFDMITALVGPFQTVDQINLYALDGNSVGTGMLTMQKFVNLSEKSWYSDVMASDGKKYITTPRLSDSAQMLFDDVKNHLFISLFRVYHDEVYRPEGIVEVTLDCDTLFEYVNAMKVKNPNTKLFVFNKSGAQIYPYLPSSELGAFYFNTIQNDQLLATHNYTIHNPTTSEKEIIFYDQAVQSGWTVIVVDSAKTLLAPLYHYTFIFILVALFILLSTTLLSYFTAKKVTVPLHNLVTAFSDFDLKTLLQDDAPHAPLISGDVGEITALNNAFTEMRTLLKASSSAVITARTEETKAKMLALQSMMNPHFIYNNLTNISVMAEEKMNTEIIALCNNVSFILRYISEDTPKGVTLKSELAYTVKYLECMKLRYGESLYYTVDIPESMENIIIPKLLIQPLVENAIMHGFNMQPPWHVHIDGYLTNDNRYKIIVSDNGVGFDPTVIKEFQETVAQIQTTTELPPLKIGGMGLINIYYRLFLLYGTDANLNIDNNSPIGSKVTIFGGLDAKQQQPTTRIASN